MLREFSKLFFNVLIEILQRGKNYRERWIWTTKIDINITLGIVKPRFRNNFRDWIISWNQFSKKWVSSTNLTQNFNFLELIHPFLFFFFFLLDDHVALREKKGENKSSITVRDTYPQNSILPNVEQPFLKASYYRAVFAFKPWPRANYSGAKARKKCRLHRRLNCSRPFAYA